MIFKKKAWKKPDLSSPVLHNIMAGMTLIPAGSFLMGSNSGEDDERPIHNVFIDSFYLAKFTVTQREWLELMGTRPWQNISSIREGDDFPAVNIEWYDTQAFIKGLNKICGRVFRLPTEAEWEYACRAGINKKLPELIYKWKLSKYAWYHRNSFNKGVMHPLKVGQKKPSNFGLYDMLGNVYEWCSDWYRRNYYNKAEIQNPKGPRYGKDKAVRGGDWGRTEYFLRFSSRRYYSPHFKAPYLGFRLAACRAAFEKLLSDQEKTLP